MHTYTYLLYHLLIMFGALGNSLQLGSIYAVERMCVYIYMYAHTCIHTHTCCIICWSCLERSETACSWVRSCASFCARLDKSSIWADKVLHSSWSCVFVCMYLYIHLCVFVRTHTHIHTGGHTYLEFKHNIPARGLTLWTHKCMYLYIYIHIYLACTHTYLRAA